MLLFQYLQCLVAECRADRDYHAGAGFKLVDQGLRHLFGGGGHDDRIERGVFLPADVAISDPYRDIGETEAGQGILRLPAQCFDDLYGIDMAHQPRQDRGLVA